MKFVLSLLLLLICNIGVFALEGTALITRATNVISQFQNICPNRPPYISTTTEIHRDNMVHLHMFIFNHKVVNGKADVMVSIVKVNPDGSKKEIVKNVPALFGPNNGKGLFVSPVTVNFKFEDKDASGLYQYEVTFVDNNDNGKSITHTAKITLLDGEGYVGGVMSKREINNYLMNYFRKPEPEKFFSALRGLFELSAKNSNKNRRNIEGLILFGLSRILHNNPQLIKPLVRFSATLNNEMQRQQVAMLLNSCSGDEVQTIYRTLDPATKLLLDKLAGLRDNLALPEQVQQPMDLDRLWCEFFVTGEFAPVLSIIKQLHRGDELPIEEVKKRGLHPQLTVEERRHFANSLISRAARWSLESNCKAYTKQKKVMPSLVFFYVESAVERGLIEDKIAEQRARQVLENVKKVCETQATAPQNVPPTTVTVPKSQPAPKPVTAPKPQLVL